MMNIAKHIITRKLPLLFATGFLVSSCQHRPEVLPPVVPFAGADTAQVDSLLSVLTLEEKIGQLILWEPETVDEAAAASILHQVRKGRVGGLLLPKMQVQDFLMLTDSSRQLAALPLWVGTCQKISLHNQFTNVPQLPLPATLAAIDSSALHRQLEEQFQRQCTAAGINLMFSPTLKTDDTSAVAFDFQTFEGEEQALLERGQQTLQHLRAHRILTVGDDFQELKYIENDSLKGIFLQSYRTFAREGMSGLLLNEKVFHADTLRRSAPGGIKKYLRKEVGFNGLTFARLGRTESPAFKLFAGAGVLITGDAQKTFYTLVKMVERGRLLEPDIDARVREVLMAKAWMRGGRLPVRIEPGTVNAPPHPARLVSHEQKYSTRRVPMSKDALAVRAEGLQCYFEDPQWIFFIRTLFQHSVAIAGDEAGTLPFKNIGQKDFRVFGFSRRPFKHFEALFSKYADFKSILFSPAPGGKLVFPEGEMPGGDSTVAIVLLDSIDLRPDFHSVFIARLREMERNGPVVFVNFGNPKNLKYLRGDVTSVQIFERNPATEAYAAQLLFGGVPSLGRLPLTVNGDLSFDAAVHNPAVRLGFGLPEDTGISAERLVGINAIAETAIGNGVFPGCEVLVAKDGKVIFSKAFGYHTYKTDDPVKVEDLYDLASVSKVAATTLGIMQQVENGAVSLDGTLGDYLTLDSTATVKKIKIQDLLLHRSGLPPMMPIGKYISWRHVPAKGCNDFYCKKEKGEFDIPVVEGLYLRDDYPDSIWKRVFHMRVSSRKRYVYSDVNFFLLQKVLETTAKVPLESYLDESFYRKMGLRRTLYNPLERFSKAGIVPTENDRIWRKTLVHGYVHDPSAALMGGVGGNAGLFSNAEEVAVIFQMLLNDGTYGGERFFDPETVKLFTSQKKGSYRALGFERAVNRKHPTYSRQASDASFGHTGFTGTCVWADPDSGLIYVFLSNRVHPNARNSKIFSEAIRSRIHEVVYKAFDTYHPALPVLSDETE
jgi:beta-N-acetylhexosaminidase